MIGNEINIAVYTEVPPYIGKIYPPVYLYRMQGKKSTFLLQTFLSRFSCLQEIMTLHYYHARWLQGIAFPPIYDKIIPTLLHNPQVGA